MLRPTDTIAALATPAGTAALALLRVSGPDTLRLAGDLAGAPPPPRVARHLDYRDAGGTLLDDVLVTFFAGPRSYTGEDALEISCHGNPFIAQKILEDLFARGCRPAEPGEFTQRAFLNGRMDLSQAEAVMDLIQARSERALAVAQQQLRGELGRRISGLVEALLGVLARVEAYIDFPEEDLPPEDRGIVVREVARIAGESNRLLATSHYGAILRDGIKTVILGPPNVGKSSLLNRLVGRPRALVSPEPGTTRDFIEELIIIGPHGLRLIDTAGVHATPAPLERLGIEQTLQRAAEADLSFLVLDATRPDLMVPAEIFSQIRREAAILVVNKIDLSPAFRVPSGWPEGIPIVRLSALTGEGFDELVATVKGRADSFQKAQGDETIAVNARHARALTEAQEGLERAHAKLMANEPVELIASDLRTSLSAFGEITGKVDNERMLDQLFSSFCIGK
ncbi:MAG: tRNA uridine-5-carboxymethylaminomethyl(34) synthesis GTPase MnmE [Opitutus sp.]|nr:tRNA uridine-5-carboxymethylaminomethyl(34) synthesis GTPase MnmE [Opitutus sp.]